LAACAISPSNERQFDCWISQDSLPYSQGQFKTWFYFSVSGAEGEFYFSIRNMAFQQQLYKNGLKPVYKAPNQKWRRCIGPVVCQEQNQAFTVTFSHTFKSPSDPVYFAWTYPWSYQDQLKKTKKWVQTFSQIKGIYIHREILTYSIEKRTVELITLTEVTEAT
jgi:hypothetical protein